MSSSSSSYSNTLLASVVRIVQKRATYHEYVIQYIYIVRQIRQGSNCVFNSSVNFKAMHDCSFADSKKRTVFSP